MQTMGAFEAKTHFSTLLEQVLQGEGFIITKHGHPIAKLIPIESHGRIEVSEAISRLRALSETSSLDGLDWKVFRDEGRR